MLRTKVKYVWVYPLSMLLLCLKVYIVLSSKIGYIKSLILFENETILLQYIVKWFLYFL